MSRTGLWDSHAHMDSEYYASDRDELLQSLSHELEGIINPGCDGDSSSFAVKLAEQYDFVYAAVGYHPEELGKLPADYLEQLALWARHPKVVAIGEIGLDYYWKDNEPREVQRRVFLEQAALAEEYGLPLIIHDRDAHGDMLELFQKQITGVEAVFHCFSGSLEMAKELLKRGYYLGFGGTSTYKNAEKVREVLRYAPRDRILLKPTVRILRRYLSAANATIPLMLSTLLATRQNFWAWTLKSWLPLPPPTPEDCLKR